MQWNEALLTNEQARTFGFSASVFQHGLCDSGAFSDIALAQLLDKHPREHIHALTMGDDPTRPNENLRLAHDHLSGSALIHAVKHGRLWLNIKHVDEVHEEMRDLVNSLYGSLRRQVDGFAPERTRATLLISSPRALVYYHVDGPPSLLWHLRGKKRIWIYPALDERFVSRDDLEDIHAGAKHEYVPYQPEFDAYATVIDLDPGQVASWPQNAPHRITNADMFNVSLATEHYTEASRRRARIYRANRFLRRTLHVRAKEACEQGLATMAKVALHRLCVMARIERVAIKQHQPVTPAESRMIRLDAAASSMVANSVISEDATRT
ncbi:MAG: hypothetical protein H7Z43_15725 [Clostridia bacterium]|nr:hypothetical protein [Deltaproteobacteria bacterium]